ncbi:hypothetical protein CFIO01_06307 [Colletotrichum fioriniae PJ7]|uniref:DUF4038 domain-containing protein n=1 Tax=Colletotrichum fioriniae PJ7 TaxID=1445577 RepID=A0A010R5T4_9PEZI|nr:hypothetical protein CFIO01_06307 [Colletotrichum fioriniae PJ7]
MSNLDTAKPPPHFKKEGDYHRLIFDGKPFLIIGGEIAPSTSSSAASMARKWQDIKTLGLNTVLPPSPGRSLSRKKASSTQTWSQILLLKRERQESELYSLEQGLADILPTEEGSIDAWVLVPTAMISLFGPDFTTAEKTAFAEFVQQVETADPDYDTTLMLQIGSEIGYSNCSRDRCDAVLTAHAWEEFADDSEGTDQLLTTYHVASHIKTLAKIAKKAYLVPVIVNAAHEASEGKRYGGPLPKTLHLWKLFAPCIDLYAPRMFHPKYDEICETWGSGANQALLVQAHGRCEDDIRLIWSAFGSHGATGVVFSRIEDWGIWNPESHTIQHVNLLRQAGPFLLDAQDQDQPHIGIAYNGWDPEELHFTSGEFDITTSGRMTRHMYGLAISQGNGKLLLFGHKFELEAESLNDDVVSTHILSCRELKVNE